MAEDSELRHPVCQRHWDEMRKEAMGAVPWWSKPIAALKVKEMLGKRGFFISATACSYCQTGSPVDTEEQKT